MLQFYISQSTIGHSSHSSCALWLLLLLTGLGLRFACAFRCGTLTAGAGQDVDRMGYARGSCYFMLHGYHAYADIPTKCEQVWSGSAGAIFPDVHVAVNEVLPSMVGETNGGFGYVSGYQPDTSAEPGTHFDGWVWVTPEGDELPIPEPERATRQSAGDATHPPNNIYMMMRTVDFKLGDTGIRGHVFLAQAGKVGVGAELNAAFAAPDGGVCARTCADKLACLAYSWHAQNGTCQHHWVTHYDAKVTLVDTANHGDAFFVIQ